MKQAKNPAQLTALWESILEWSRRPLENNPAAKILAFTLAVGIWFFVQGQQVMEVKAILSSTIAGNEPTLTDVTVVYQ